MNKKDIRNIIIIITIFLIYVLINIISGNTYISEVDFISQHFRIPEYFRTLFYDNFDLLPNFAFHLGAGQNIYYLSYHGLLSPITLISYLFPFLKMSTYIVLTNIILVILSIIFFYKFLITKFNTNITTTTTFIFTFAGPLIFHTHRHIMFNNYMLFLILALIAVDIYFTKHKKSPLIISIFLIIMTSYYYSVTSIITICIYALYKYLSITKKVNMKQLFKELIKFVLTVFIPILTSAILLLPTIYALKNGRSETLNDINILSLLIPNFNINNFMYQPYSVGLPSILIFSIIDLFLNNKKENKTLSIISIIILTFPIICFILNGFMYIDGKCFIPLLPLFCYMIALTLNNITKKDYNIKPLIIIALITLLLTIITNLDYKYLVIYIIDNIIIILALLLYKIKNNIHCLSVPIILFSIITFIVLNSNDTLIDRKTLNTIDNINNNVEINYDINYRTANLFYILENVNNVIDNKYYTTSIYSSTSNSYYTNFTRNIFQNEIYNKDYHTLTQSSNILFNMYMGNKYLITNKDKIGYEKINENVYKNDNVFTIGYATNNIMSNNTFEKLEYPYNIDALMKYTIVNKDINTTYNNDVIKYQGNYEIIDNNLNYNYINNKYVFDVTNNANLKIKLDENIKDKIIIITFDMNYNDTIDTSITINDVKNTLSYKGWKYHNNNYTFNYVIDSTNILDINITKGHYEIDNINLYVLDYNNYKNISNTHDKFIIEEINNKIIGNISVTKENSYFTLSIPYDKGFVIKVNDEIIDYELVNTSFIGFELDKGNHKIEIEYTPPFYNLAILISGLGVIIFIIVLWRERNEKN